MSSNSDYLSPREIAEILKVSSRTITRIIQSGKLKAVRVGSSWRVSKIDFQEYLNENSNKKD